MRGLPTRKPYQAVRRFGPFGDSSELSRVRSFFSRDGHISLATITEGIRLHGIHGDIEGAMDLYDYLVERKIAPDVRMCFIMIFLRSTLTYNFFRKISTGFLFILVVLIQYQLL